MGQCSHSVLDAVKVFFFDLSLQLVFHILIDILNVFPEGLLHKKIDFG
jgi:hypothetical protein